MSLLIYNEFRKIQRLREIMVDMKKHLDSDEKIVHFFRPSRRAYIHKYFFFIIILTVCIYFAFYFKSNIWFMLAACVAGLYPLYGLVKTEWFIFSSRYALTNEKVIYSRGIFIERFRSFNYYAITDVELYQNLWGKIVNTGTLRLNTSGSGAESYEINFINIAEPMLIKKKLNDLTPKKMHIGHVEGVHIPEKDDFKNKEKKKLGDDLEVYNSEFDNNK